MLHFINQNHLLARNVHKNESLALQHFITQNFSSNLYALEQNVYYRALNHPHNSSSQIDRFIVPYSRLFFFYYRDAFRLKSARACKHVMHVFELSPNRCALHTEPSIVNQRVFPRQHKSKIHHHSSNVTNFERRTPRQTSAFAVRMFFLV